jgi:solute carrier family 12 (potassium/chloride transporters), member 9
VSWQVGVLGMVAIFTLAGASVVLTALSMAAIVTNGHMKSGGVYYLVSRSAS